MRNLFVALALLSSALVAPAFSRAQPSPPVTPMPGYLLVVGKSTDRVKIGGYAASLPAIYASNNAYYLAIGATGRGVTWLEGPWRDRSVILAAFPSRAGVDAFWWGDAYRAAIRKRDNAGAFSVVALDGTIARPYEGKGTGFLIVMTGPRDNSPGQLALSSQATLALRHGVESSGGTFLTSNEAGKFTSMEGDTLFDRFSIAVWPSLAARDSYIRSPLARRAARLRRKLGTSAVASADGVPSTQAPPAATPP